MSERTEFVIIAPSVLPLVIESERGEVQYVEVIEPVSDVIEVITSGPKGEPGGPGDPGEQGEPGSGMTLDEILALVSIQDGGNF